MKHLDLRKLADTVVSRRKTLKLSQSVVSVRTGINRSLLSRLETGDYTPSVDQFLALSEVLDFDRSALFVDDAVGTVTVERKKIAVAGTGYVGLSLAVLLSQHNDVTAVDIVPEKVEKLNNWQSPIQDEYIEKYLAEHETRNLSLKATTDGESAYQDADFIIVAAPTNYDPKTNFFDCSAVESVLALIQKVTGEKKKKPTVVIKSTIPVGYTVQVRREMDMDNITSCTLSSQLLKGCNDSRFGSLFVDECTDVRISDLLQHLLHQWHILVTIDFRPTLVHLFANTNDKCSFRLC